MSTRAVGKNQPNATSSVRRNSQREGDTVHSIAERDTGTCTSTGVVQVQVILNK
jgi:thiamine biosynthesis lipoprotein ApbE